MFVENYKIIPFMFSFTVSNDIGVVPVAGCTSTDVCEIAPLHGVLPFMEEVGNLTSGPTCCGTDNCNDFTEPLQCLSCTDSSCFSPVSVNCSSETMCITASIKGSLCLFSGTFKFSTDVVASYKIIDAECCDTNNCNSETLLYFCFVLGTLFT
uniref:UPAR/Ly6 domain-containing protein n=1 Tax=Gouania willdenowi TaxID=441366 RepID=A0A8C5HR84_GOUWI